MPDISSKSSGLIRLGTSPLLRMLLMSCIQSQQLLLGCCCVIDCSVASKLPKHLTVSMKAAADTNEAIVSWGDR